VPERVVVDAPAKVNLQLRILAREAGGFHGLETVFCAISLADTVEIRRGGPGVSLSVDGGGDLGPPERNLAVRAAHAYHAARGAEPSVEIRLRKRIPAAAGLGGGSSDAAAVLRALDALSDDPIGDDALLRIGGTLGSDVPFFLGGSALALGWARGDRLLALPPLPAREAVVAHPGVEMPTGPAFARIAAARGEEHTVPARRLTLDDLATWDAVARISQNDFEPGADALVASLVAARRAMREAGAAIAMLAGSGASLFGVFPPTADPSACHADLKALGYRVFRAHTLQALPPPQVDPPSALG
jgi:4-diphosphocytidyl-2-C-methyl-D-erythritol kinase